MKNRLLLLATMTLLAACAAQQPTDTSSRAAQELYTARADIIGRWPVWGLSGRLGIENGWEGGSGRLDWSNKESGSSLQFRGAMGQGAWRLEVGENGATLTRADGTTTDNPSVNALIESEAGWEIPIEALQWWVRGLAMPGSKHSMSVNEQGLAEILVQNGWQVTFEKYVVQGDQQLPSRIEAVSGSYKVKLAVSRWWQADADDA